MELVVVVVIFEVGDGVLPVCSQDVLVLPGKALMCLEEYQSLSKFITIYIGTT